MEFLKACSKMFRGTTDVFTDNKSNSWIYLRLVAAVAVIYGHSGLLTPGGSAKDFFMVHLAGGITYSGQMAVIFFFFLSGALVTKSLENSDSPSEFAIKRFARIYPGLGFAVLITSFLLPLSLGRIFSFRNSLKYFFQNAPAITNQYVIPGLFSSAKNQGVNGSLWTLPNEIRCYLILFIIYCLFSPLRRNSMLALCSIICWFLIYSPGTVPLIGSNPALKGNSLWVINSLFFFLGSLTYLLGLGKLKARIWLGASLVIYLCWRHNENHHLYFFIAVISFLMALTRIPLPRIENDYSFGIYLYGWPSAQVINYVFPWTNSTNGFLLSTMLASVLAVFSWHVIEKPAMTSIRRRLKQ